MDPEEVWVRSTNIPAIQLKLGNLRGTFGKHGLLHTHAFPFIQAPVIMANTIGEEGFKDAGLEAAWLTPLPWYAELTGGVYEAIGLDDDHPLDFGSTRHDNVPYLGHFKNQFDVNDATTMELGASTLQGRGIDDRQHGAYGADLTFRNVPREELEPARLDPAERVPAEGLVRRRDLRARVGRRVRVVPVPPLAGLVGGRPRRAGPRQLHGLPRRRRGRSAPRQGEPRLRQPRVDALGVLVRAARVQPRQAAADAGIHPTDDRIMIQLSYTIGYHPAHAY